MSHYVRVTLGTLTVPSNSPSEDGAELVRQCLADLDHESHPPKLFIAWITPAFRESYRPLLQGIQTALVDRNLEDCVVIGASAAACMFDGRVYEQGAELVCVSSRFLNVRSASATVNSASIRLAAKNLVSDLDIRSKRTLNSQRNELLLLFLPRPDKAHGIFAKKVIRAINRLTDSRLPIFGGVSSAGLDTNNVACQFLNGKVHSDRIVGAAIRAEFSFGLALSDGLVETGAAQFQVEDLQLDGHVVKTIGGRPAKEAMRNDQYRVTLLRYVSPEDGTVILAPKVRQDSTNGDLEFINPVPERTPLTLVAADGDQMMKSVMVARTRIRKSLGIRSNEFTAVLGIGCVARYRDSDLAAFDIQRALRAVSESEIDCYAGCYLDGELGQDSTGQPVATNWSVSELLLFDEIAAAAQIRLGFEALRQPIATDQLSVEQVISAAMQRISIAGWSGGMISLIMDDGPQKWITGVESLGDGWKTIVEPNTQRRLESNDILAEVAQTGECVLITDAESDGRCKAELAREAGHSTFYVLPLRSDGGSVFGTLQIELHDRHSASTLGSEELQVLQAFSTRISSAISQSMRRESLLAANHLDELAHRLERNASLEVAVAEFSRELAELLGMDGHARLLDHHNNTLRLVGGRGEYYDAIKGTSRQEVGMDDGSPAICRVREGTSRIVNDAISEGSCAELGARYTGAISDATKRMACFADFLFHDAKGDVLGVVSMYNRRKWRFTHWRVDIARAAIRRMESMIALLQYKRAHEGAEIELQVMRHLAEPTASAEIGALHSATVSRLGLQHRFEDQLQRLANSLGAEKACCFLWDDTQQRFILRAQVGWVDPRWVGAAWFGRDQGLTGTVAMGKEPCHIADLRLYEAKVLNGRLAVGKYAQEMLGFTLDGSNSLYSNSAQFEFIGLPLIRGREHLGVLTLYRSKSSLMPNGSSGFATTDRRTLTDVMKQYSAFFHDCMASYLATWQHHELNRLTAVFKVLIETQDANALSEVVCRTVGESYRAVRCELYLLTTENEKPTLRLEASWSRQGEGASDEFVNSSDDIRWLSAVYNETKEKRWPISESQAPARVRCEGHIQHVALPLQASDADVRAIQESNHDSPGRPRKRPFGVLALRWKGVPDFASNGEIIRHDTAILKDLASRIATTMRIQRLRSDYELNLLVTSETTRRLASLVTLVKAHDFLRASAPLALQLQALQTQVPTDLQADFARVEETAQKLKQDIQFLRTITRQFNESKREAIRLDHLIEQILTHTGKKAEDCGISIYKRILEVQIDAIPDLLAQAIKILLDNSIEALLEVGSARRLQLSVILTESASDVSLKIIDNGNGMTEEFARQVLKGNGGTHKENGGGIGVLLARLVAEYHGGSLQIETSVDGGTTFILSLGK